MINNSPKITIVTVCYNAAKDIEGTILSVINQTYNNIEYLVIDGGSTDATVEIIKKYETYLTSWISEKDQGVYDAMNKGIKLATGDWINFMNAGDMFSDNDVLTKISNYLDDKYDVIYGDYRVNKRGNRFIVKSDEMAISGLHSLAMGFNHQASFVRSDVARENPFDLRYKLASDFNMMKTIYRAGGRFLSTGIIVVDYDLTGLSNKNIFQHRYECLQINNPDCHLENWVKAFLHYVRIRIQTNSANIIQIICPILLRLYYKRRKDLSFE